MHIAEIVESNQVTEKQITGNPSHGHQTNVSFYFSHKPEKLLILIWYTLIWRKTKQKPISF